MNQEINAGVRARPTVQENVNGTTYERDHPSSENEEDAVSSDERRGTTGRLLFKIIVSLVCGIIFGFAMEKGRGTIFYMNNSKHNGWGVILTKGI